MAQNFGKRGQRLNIQNYYSQIIPSLDHLTRFFLASVLLFEITSSGTVNSDPIFIKCSNCGYTTDRDVAAAQVVLLRGLAAVGHTSGKFVGIPQKQESPG